MNDAAHEIEPLLADQAQIVAGDHAGECFARRIRLQDEQDFARLVATLGRRGQARDEIGIAGIDAGFGARAGDDRGDGGNGDRRSRGGRCRANEIGAATETEASRTTGRAARKIAGTAAEIARTTTEIAGAATDIPGAATDIPGAATDIARATTDVPRATTDIAWAMTYVSRTATDIARTATDVSRAATEITRTAPDIARTATKIAGTTTDVSRAATEITRTATKITGAAPDIARTATKVAGATPDVSGTTPHIAAGHPADIAHIGDTSLIADIGHAADRRCAPDIRDAAARDVRAPAREVAETAKAWNADAELGMGRQRVDRHHAEGSSQEGEPLHRLAGLGGHVPCAVSIDHGCASLERTIAAKLATECFYLNAQLLPI
jgi:hypothetical protein